MADEETTNPEAQPVDAPVAPADTVPVSAQPTPEELATLPPRTPTVDMRTMAEMHDFPGPDTVYEIVAPQVGCFAKGAKVKGREFGPRQSISRLLQKGEITKISG